MPDSVDGRAGIDVHLVERLIAAQFPHWRGLPVTPVEHDGWDNRTYRLGDEMTVRLPAAAGYALAIAKERRWLPRLAPALPIQVPVILADGAPDLGYPFPWSVRRWIQGETADRAPVDDMTGLAVSMAEFLRALHRCDTTAAPAAGAHSFHRGTPPSYYDQQTRYCLNALTHCIDTTLAATIWENALATEWDRSPVWFHGDLVPTNLLVDDGKLTAIIDFGTCGVGDPACDLVLAWTLLSGDSREAFRRAVDQDEGTWARARGWALRKAMLTLTDHDAADRDHTTRTGSR
ncbi:aminoglycoside phosphotransferase family protein [Nocardia lijiangensis]|uniref:aminoglycoside phosphotransferase family protein n=1 Tax=Nocardia lijiangensis TaxID=299618 RepID=UPI003D732B5F